MFLKLYLIALPVFFGIDMIWLGIVAKSFYAKQIGFLMRTNFNWVAAIALYMLLVAGLVFFVITPAVQGHAWKTALGLGALFGFITYATYDLTNLATIKNWPLPVTFIDMLWGTCISALVSLITYAIVSKIG